VPAADHSDGAGETVFVRKIATQWTSAAGQFQIIGPVEASGETGSRNELERWAEFRENSKVHEDG
jgi:hypothetical protein